MIKTQSVPDVRTNRFLQALILFYVVFWMVMAISPFDRSDWLLENLLVLLSVGFMIATYRSFALSNLSFLMITVFLTLHAIGAHYTYEHVPLGEWMKGSFGVDRNHYDRIVHLAFGLLVTYPIAEALRSVTKVVMSSALVLSVFVLFASSGFFELVESLFATIVSPALGRAYLGTQGDLWDAQKDMAAALVGSLLCLIALRAVRRPVDLLSKSPESR